MAANDLAPDREPDPDLVARVTSVCRKVDPLFEKEGGGTRHWVRDWFLPGLDEAGLMIVEKPARAVPDGDAVERYEKALAAICDTWDNPDHPRQDVRYQRCVSIARAALSGGEG